MTARYSCVLALAALALGAPAAAQTVNVLNFEFTPATLNIHLGDTVEWHNNSGVHSVRETTAGTPEGFGRAAGTNWIYLHTFHNLGTFTYDCSVHPDMQGTIHVTLPASTEPPPEAGVRLDAPSPNPFTSAVDVRLSVARAEDVRVAVHDLAGREVALLHDGRVTPTSALALTWEPGAGVAAGAYLLVVSGDSFEMTRRIIRTR